MIKYVKRLIKIIPKEPKNIQIEISNKCNLKCKTCPRKKYGVSEKNMSLKTFYTVLNNLV
jgi:MoaA/NifB/PqqE/SkfB family radical SAM enzyme